MMKRTLIDIADPWQAILGGSEEILADMAMRQAMKFYPQGARL